MYPVSATNLEESKGELNGGTPIAAHQRGKREVKQIVIYMHNIKILLKISTYHDTLVP